MSGTARQDPPAPPAGGQTGAPPARTAAEQPPAAPHSGAARGPRRRGRGPEFWFAAGWLALMVCCAVFGALLPLAPVGAPVGPPAQPPALTWPEPLGTDAIGRSVLSRIVGGAQISLLVGGAATLLGAAAGGLLGLLAAQLRGAVETVVDILSNTVLAFPPMLLLLALAAVLRPSVWTLTVSLGLLTIPAFTRLMKANALAALNREYVLAARALGAGTGRLLFREVLPNTAAALLAYAVVQMAVLIVAEGSLSFLGLGIPPPAPSWGGMIAAGRDRLATEPFLVAVPGVAFVLTVYALNTVGERLRARFDTGDAKL